MPAGKEYILGIDVGSVSANIVSIGPDREVAEEYYIRTYGKPFATIETFLSTYTQRAANLRIKGVAFTGTAGQFIAQGTGCHCENEIIAQTRAVSHLEPQVRTVIEMGGQDAKMIFLEPTAASAKLRIKDFSMNALCAAGTGSFLDQQASRLGLSIEDFSRLATLSKHPARIAGRCSVFAKSDMIHLQQSATPDYDIVAGLCFAVARNFKSTIGKGFRFETPLSFQGGVAANAGMRQAFMAVFELAAEDFVIPRYFASMGAIGAALLAWEHPDRTYPFPDLTHFVQTQSSGKTKAQLPRLLAPRVQQKYSSIQHTDTPDTTRQEIEAFMGIDVGSISTNLVVIDKDQQLLAKRYLMTAGRPLEAIQCGLREIGAELGHRVIIKGVGTTGSGRYLTADFIGADVIKNEITAQARAATHIDRRVDTIFEIGGQDSKYISLQDGVVVDFSMNKVCAAGTGSFLEEQAERLGISIQHEFADLALCATAPVPLGERCTVFMESDMVNQQQHGASRENLVAGLCRSIALNYLNKVVGDKKIGSTIFFQGGTAFNAGVVAAFEQVLGNAITVPEHHEVTGALGAALLARECPQSAKSRFKGFDLSNRGYDLTSFECQGCANSCEIKRLCVNGEAPIFYGGRCEKYETGTRQKTDESLPDLFVEREQLLERFSHGQRCTDSSKGTIGIPRALIFHELLPFFMTFFRTLGYEAVLSDKTNKKIINEGVEAALAETCFPVKVAHGHALNLTEKKISHIFLPSMVSYAPRHPQDRENSACPYVQAIPYTIAAAIDFTKRGIQCLRPVIHMRDGRTRVAQELSALRQELRVTSRQIRQALNEAYQAQELFSQARKKRGAEILGMLRPDQHAMVIISRPYNGCDAGVNLQVPQKLRDLGVLAIPMDFLPIEDSLSQDTQGRTCWHYGQKIVAAAQFITKHPQLNLNAIYLTNFGCGPDSFITHLFKTNLQGAPYLVLEIDEHSADTGVITRLEAFIDSLPNARRDQQTIPAKHRSKGKKLEDRTMYIPGMSDHARVMAAAFNACGMDAQVMPESDGETLSWGTKVTSGRECYPCILTTGDIVKVIKSPGFDPDRSAFFMPSGRGPCRFGQYNRFHRQVLDDLGYPDIPVFAPVQDEKIYESFNGLAKDFSQMAWRGIVAVDLLGKELLRTRPYEAQTGAAEAVYGEFLQRLCARIKKKQKLEPVLRESRTAFAAVAVKRITTRPLVGIVGEIYIRSNRFGNENLIKKVEALGGEALLAPVSEWILYTNYTAKEACRAKKKYYQLLKLRLKDGIQKGIERRMENLFYDGRHNSAEPSIEEVLQHAQPYLDASFEGEAILSIGKSIDYLNRGVNGIITVMPFTCMPGTIVNAIMRRCRDDYRGFPLLNLAYDGQQETNAGIRLETFMHQVRNNKSCNA